MGRTRSRSARNREDSFASVFRLAGRMTSSFIEAVIEVSGLIANLQASVMAQRGHCLQRRRVRRASGHTQGRRRRAIGCARCRMRIRPHRVLSRTWRCGGTLNWMINDVLIFARFSALLTWPRRRQASRRAGSFNPSFAARKIPSRTSSSSSRIPAISRKSRFPAETSMSSRSRLHFAACSFSFHAAMRPLLSSHRSRPRRLPGACVLHQRRC